MIDIAALDALPLLFAPFAADPLLLRLGLAVLALLLDAAIGDPKALWAVVPHPVVILGGLTKWLDRRLNRLTKTVWERRLRGLLAVVIVVSVAVAAGLGVAYVTAEYRWGWAAEVVFVGILVAQRDMYVQARRVQVALKTGGLSAGRDAVAHIVGRDPDTLDQHGVARAAIESVAENFSDGVVAPILWYLALGPAGIAAYKAINTLDSMIGHRSERYVQFGKAAARLDDLANLIPARFAGLLLALAALFMPSANPFRALATMARDAGNHRSPNSGWPEAAMAGALGLALAGPRRYDGRIVDDKWIGRGRARATPEDIGRALGLFAYACLALALLTLLALAGRLGWAS
jgi:adenosylcobinamide-phosphate synthase